ncbi:MAG: SET domain-containing protein [Nanoarchaeota archaeon]
MTNTNFIIREAPGCGKGVFSTKSHRKEEILFVFAEKVVPWTKANHRSVQLGKNRWLTPGKQDMGYYVNHSCDPNARFKKPHFIAALRSIKAGEEITLDYSTLVDIPKWDMECACGEKNCRKIIKSYSKSPKETQKKYENMLSFIANNFNFRYSEKQI